MGGKQHSSLVPEYCRSSRSNSIHGNTSRTNQKENKERKLFKYLQPRLHYGSYMVYGYLIYLHRQTLFLRFANSILRQVYEQVISLMTVFYMNDHSTREQSVNHSNVADLIRLKISRQLEAAPFHVLLYNN